MFVSAGSHLATLLMYLISPVMIALASWKLVFFASSICAVVFLMVWQLYAGSVKKKYGRTFGASQNSTAEEAGATGNITLKKLFISSGLVIVMVAVIMQGFLRDGIATWMPAYLSDVFLLSSEVLILTTVVLPIFSLFSAYIILGVRNKLCRDELKLAEIIFLLASLSIGLLLIFRTNMLLSVLFLAFASGCSHAVNLLLVCLLPKRFEKYGRFSLVTGAINSCTYIGAAVSTYGFAAVSEGYGWNVTLALWAIIALVGFGCCLKVSGKQKPLIC